MSVRKGLWTYRGWELFVKTTICRWQTLCFLVSASQIIRGIGRLIVFWNDMNVFVL